MKGGTELKALLKRTVGHQLIPHILKLGFQPAGVGRKAKPQTATQFHRVRDMHADVLLLQWDRYGGPWFIIEFSILHVEHVQVSQLDSVEFWEAFVAQRRVSANPVVELWFGVRRPLRWIAPEVAANWAVSSATRAIQRMDRFMRFGTSSPFIRDMSLLVPPRVQDQ